MPVFLIFLYVFLWNKNILVLVTANDAPSPFILPKFRYVNRKKKHNRQTSGKHVREFYTPLNPTLYRKTGFTGVNNVCFEKN